MSLKMEFTRKVLRVKKAADAKKANVVSNSIYDVLEINNKSREVPNTLKKIAMRELNVTHTYIANVHCLEFKPRLKLKFYKNTPKESDLLYFYIHGGGFVGGFPEQGTYLIKALAQRFGLTTIAVDYTLSPEAIFPYSLNQIVNVYKEIIKTHSKRRTQNVPLTVPGAMANSAMMNTASVTVGGATAFIIDVEKYIRF